MESKTTDDIPVPKKPKVNTMRNHWFAHVAKTRKRLQKASKGSISHRDREREGSKKRQPAKTQKKHDNALIMLNYAFLCFSALLLVTFAHS